jgi:hypothetical protein
MTTLPSLLRYLLLISYKYQNAQYLPEIKWDRRDGLQSSLSVGVAIL